MNIVHTFIAAAKRWNHHSSLVVYTDDSGDVYICLLF